MARKHKHPEHENLERWLVSYADFMTLLFATFTALYAMAQTDAAKLKDVGAAIREGFAEQSILSGIKSIMEGKSAPSANPDPIASTQGAGAGIMGKFDSMSYEPGEVKSTQHLVDDLTSDLKDVSKAMHQAIVAKNPNKPDSAAELGRDGKAGQGEQGKAVEDPQVSLRPVDIAFQQRGVRISFDSRMLFDPGSANLRSGSEKVLDIVAKRLKHFDNRRIHVEGHTDATGIATAIFPSNWELSSARASRVVRFFIDRHQFNPPSLVAVGYGSTQPLSDNRTPEGRTRNRRVDIILYNAEESMKLNPRVQFMNERPVQTKTSAPRAVIPVVASPNLPISAKSSKGSDQPVRVIIQEKDGSEHVWTPPISGKVSPTDGKATPVSIQQAAPVLGTDKTLPVHPKAEKTVPASQPGSLAPKKANHPLIKRVSTLHESPKSEKKSPEVPSSSIPLPQHSLPKAKSTHPAGNALPPVPKA
jgi:chemotaxis protein MotB